MRMEDVERITKIIKDYRNYIVENLFFDLGYSFDERFNFRDGENNEVILLVYRRRR